MTLPPREFSLNGKVLASLVVLGAVIPRLAHLHSSLWYDEIFSSRLKLSFSLSGFAWIAYDTHPPVYNLLMLLWTHLFGDSEISLRLLPLLCSLASIAVAWRIAITLLGRAPAWLVAALMALSGASVWYAQEARSYSFDLLIFLLLTDALIHYQASGQAKDLVKVLFYSILGAGSHLFLMIFILCLLAIWCWRLAVPQNLAALLRFVLLELVLFAPFYFFIALMMFFSEEHSYFWGEGGILHRFGPRDAAELLGFYFFGYSGMANAKFIPFVVMAVVSGAFVAGFYASRKPASSLAEGSAFQMPSFRFPHMDKLFWIVSVAAVLALLAGVPAARALPAGFFTRLDPGGKHAVLMQNMSALLTRTGLLFLVGYVGAILGWVVLGKVRFEEWRGIRKRLAPQRRLGMGRVRSSVFFFPLAALLVVMLISAVRSAYNPRYMLTLLPFVLLPVAAAIFRLPGKALRVLAIVTVLSAEAVALVKQGPHFDGWKKDYRAAFLYRMNSARASVPVSSTAYWEFENIGQYYARRLGYRNLKLVPLEEALRLKEVDVFVPSERRLEEDAKLQDFQEFLKTRPFTRRSFPGGLFLYEFSGSAR